MLCIEANETREQALLLIESLRAFGGQYADSPVFAVAPRSGLGVDAATRARLEALAATYHEAPLNTVCPEYGSANRVYAAAWAEQNCRADTLYVLDSDTLFVEEPESLSCDCDLAMRPVDVKGSTTRGPGDPFEPYWLALCELAGTAIDDLPWVETVLDHQRVRASYNGGYAVVRRSCGILTSAAELFTRSVVAELRPYKGQSGHQVVASTGPVPARAAEFWGSNQAVMAIAAWRTTRRVGLLDRRSNVPLHALAEPQFWSDVFLDLHPWHLHYHWMFDAAHRGRALHTLAKIGLPPDRLEWIAARTPLGASRRAARPASAARPVGPSRQLVICGMHRSATSLAASVLREAGLEIGKELLGPGPGNRRGHFEDHDFWQLHEDLLAAAGVTALSAGDDFTPPPGEVFRARARQLIAQRAELPLWGFKDPRTCLFLDWWEELLPAAQYLVLYRHPVEVALSLRRRATEPEVRLDPWAGIRAWEVYNRRLLRFLERQRQRAFLAQVPALTRDLPAAFARLAEQLALPLRPLGGGELFSPEELTSCRPEDLEGMDWEGLIPEALALYRRLEALADLPGERLAARAGVAPPCGTTTREPRRSVEALFHDLEATRRGRTSAPPPGSLLELRGRLEKVQTELAKHHQQKTELEAQLVATRQVLEETAEHRDELSATLVAIERSRGYRLLAGWWRLAGWLAGRLRGRGRR